MDNKDVEFFDFDDFNLDDLDFKKSEPNVQNTFGVEIIDVKHVELPEEAGSRTNIYTKKYKKTPNKYPRAYGQIKNKPLK